jgi:hypothetical protein
MTLDEWFAVATADADRRSLPDLKPVLTGLRNAAAALRAAEWNDDARGSDVTASQPSQRASS